MRIRKNARRLITSSSSSSFLICQLNRSPWDVDSFSLQGEVEDDIGVNGNRASSDSVESMELSFEYVERTLPQPQPQLQPPPIEEAPPPLPPMPAPPKKRGRPKKSTSTATTATTTTTTTTNNTRSNSNSNSNNNNNNNNNNPYEFYYYSGFGPSWGKRRGNKCTTPTNSISNCYNYNAIINDADGSPSSSTSNVLCDDDDDDNIIMNNNNSCNGKNSNVIVIDRIVEGELDYIEDDFDDDDDDEDEHLCGRRVRKPVKARSLKSLM